MVLEVRSDALAETRLSSPAPEGWTRIHAWGIAEVTETRTDAVRVGERFFGYCPMAAEMLLTPARRPTASSTSRSIARR